MYKKAQIEVLKELYKVMSGSTKTRVTYDEMPGTNYVGYCINPCYCYYILRGYNGLDPAKFEKSSVLCKLYNDSNPEYMDNTVFSGEIIYENSEALVKLITPSKEPVYIKEKYLKKFGKVSDFAFKCKSPKSAVFVELVTGTLIGAIMPVNPKKITTNE